MVGKLRFGRRARSALRAVVSRLFFDELVAVTDNFSRTTWLGRPIWQNVLDLWTIQETISEVKPALLVECGTHRGGSALFYANLFDLLGRGRVITIDIAPLAALAHPRVDVVIGSSVSADVIARVRAAAEAEAGPVMVILDSDHSRRHVRAELERYAPFVTPGSFLLVQDGIIDFLPFFRAARPGPFPAIQDFLAQHPEFEVDAERSRRFLISHHPSGWLRRKRAHS
jgi:cephalosporin hydroxylase